MERTEDECRSREFVPKDESDATQNLERLVQESLAALSRESFLRLWYALVYLYPGLHPDGYELADSGWTPQQSPLVQEAWRRATLGELSDEELYPADAAWAGICDRLAHPPEAVIDRRAWLRDH